MTRKIKTYIKYFPFSPGIPWKMNNKYLMPEIDADLYKDIVSDKNIMVTAFGGPLESFFSLATLEMLVKFFPSNKNLFWLGNNKYNFFSHVQGLSKICKINLTPDKLKKYPVPLFFDAKNNVYLNCLNNYVVKKSWWGLYPEFNKDPLLKQMSDNMMVPWDNYIPKIRKLPNDNFNLWKKVNNYNERKKSILIFPDKLDSIHNYKCLGWNEHSIRELSALLYGTGIQVLVCSNNSFYGTNIKTFKYDLELILNLIPDAWLVLSESVDWHLISMMLSNCISISKQTENYDLFKEIEFLDKDNILNIEENLTPKLIRSLVAVI